MKFEQNFNIILIIVFLIKFFQIFSCNFHFYFLIAFNTLINRIHILYLYAILSKLIS